MPWQCKQCALEVQNDGQPVCPGCGAVKTAWTLQENKTRRLTLSRSFEVLRGDGDDWAPTDVAAALPARKVRALRDAGAAPGPRDQFAVRVDAKKRDVRLTLLPEAARARDLDLPGAPPGEDLRAVAVFGRAGDPVGDLALPGLVVVDVSDETALGHVPTLEVAAAGKPAKRLRLEAARPLVTIVELEDALFRTESAALLPDGQDPEGAGAETTTKATGVGALACLLRHVDEHPGTSSLVAGHTDTTGAASYNLPLSQQRAEASRAALVGDREAFAKVCHGRHTKADVQQVLAWISGALGYPCHPGEVDGLWGPRSQAALLAFQKAYNADAATKKETLVEDGVLGARTWAAFEDCYERGLQDALGVDAAGLAALRAKLAWADPARPAVGCGEHHPIEAVGKDGYRSQVNRRVELLCFDPGEAPALACHQGGACEPEACPLYAPGAYERRHLPVMPSAKAWTPAWEGVGQDGATARMVVDAPGLPAGTPMTFTVERVGLGVVGTAEATSTEGRVEAPWSRWHDPERAPAPVALEAPAAFAPTAFTFTCEGAGRIVRSGELPYADTLHARLLVGGEVLAKQRYQLRGPWGTYTATTDDQGVAKVEGIPPGGVALAIEGRMPEVQS